MPRSVNNVASRARRKRMFKKAKGYFGTRKNATSVAKNAVDKAMVYAFAGRKQKKRDYRALWIARINAAVREEGMTYSNFIAKLKGVNMTLNRKTLADLAMNDAPAFKALIASVK